eukprot:5204598-Prymnesium_polylepis.1
MGPGYDISAAAALSCFHVFALQSRGAFDVRWCRGAISERIFAPWQARLEARGNVQLQGGARVTSVEREQGGGGRLAVSVQGQEEPLVADAVVLAVGATAAAALAEASPALSALPAARRFGELRGITCVAVRLFLQPAATRTHGLAGGAHSSTLLPPAVAAAMADSPVVVVGPAVGRLPELTETGFCVYDLQRMHDEHVRRAGTAPPPLTPPLRFGSVHKRVRACVWASFLLAAYPRRLPRPLTKWPARARQAAGELGVLEVDFYRADDLAELDDDATAALALRAAAAALG